MAVVSHVQSDSKQQVRMNQCMKLIRMNLDLKSNFCFACG